MKLEVANGKTYHAEVAEGAAAGEVLVGEEAMQDLDLAQMSTIAELETNMAETVTEADLSKTTTAEAHPQPEETDLRGVVGEVAEDVEATTPTTNSHRTTHALLKITALLLLN